MSRFRTLLIVVSLVALMLPGISLAQDTSVEQLEARLAAMEKRMAALEQNLARQLRTLEQRIASGKGAAAAPSPLEGEAQKAFANISRAAASGDMAKAKTQMDAFMGKYAATNTAKKARSLNQELQVIGKDSPSNWGIQKWYQGESEIDLAGDKTTLLVFWEEWCPHCRREVPKIQALYDTLKGDGLQVVGLTKINRSSTEEKVTNFLSQQKVGYPIAKEDGATSRHFNVSGIPAAAVVKGGKVIWRGHPNKLNETILKGWL